MPYPTERITDVADTDPIQITFNTPNNQLNTPITFQSKRDLAEFLRMVRGDYDERPTVPDTDFVIPAVAPEVSTGHPMDGTSFVIEYRAGGAGPWIPIDPRG